MWPKTKADTGFVIRIGRSLHWIGYGFAGLFLCLILITLPFQHPELGEIIEMATALVLAPATLGRAARYILANE